jgi:integrase
LKVVQSIGISPELADVLADVIHRIRQPSGAVAAVASYDPHERIWNPPMPLLFQRRFGGGNRAIPAGTIRDWICQAIPDTTPTSGTQNNSAVQPPRFTPHDFRRIFITDAVLHGMPPHIAQLVAGHRDINTTMGYKKARELHQTGEKPQLTWSAWRGSGASGSCVAAA